MRNNPWTGTHVPRVAALFFGICLLLAVAGCTNSLNRAIYREHPDLVQKFLAEGANVNEANGDGGTPLIYAAQYSDLPLIKTLVERGAKVNSTEEHGNSALGYLASGRVLKNDAVAFLLSHGADVNLANHDGRTPLHLAAARVGVPAEAAQQAELIHLLLNAGADPRRLTNRGELAFRLAVVAGQPDSVLELLLAVTQDPQGLDSSGYSALTLAAKAGSHSTVLLLINHGFSPDVSVPAVAHRADQLPMLEVGDEIHARVQEAVGDQALGQGDKQKALAAYRASAVHYDSAVADCQRVVNFWDKALKDAKAARKNRLAGLITANIVGGALAATTGVGFVSVPKRGVDNHIDEYTEVLAVNRKELTALSRDQINLSAKLHALESDHEQLSPKEIPKG